MTIPQKDVQGAVAALAGRFPENVGHWGPFLTKADSRSHRSSLGPCWVKIRLGRLGDAQERVRKGCFLWLQKINDIRAFIDILQEQ